MIVIDVNDFTREIDCIYKGERYTVRDNGAVFRHQRIGKRKRRDENQWSFGNENSSNPYLQLSGVRIHRIVATAFHGEPPNPQYVVDHIDTNCRNNRPENLRWVTRLENALMNPITRKKIEYLCGSIEKFLENPSILNDLQLEPNFKWMRTVSPEEAQNCMERMLLWANTNKKPRIRTLDKQIYHPNQKAEPVCIEYEVDRHYKLENLLTDEDQAYKSNMLHVRTNKKSSDYALSDLVYKPITEKERFVLGYGIVMALTKRCAQREWRVPSYFPCCPEEIGTNPLEDYYKNLKVGAVFSYNDHYPKSTILEFVKINNNSSILVMCEREGLKPWSIAEITFENGLFIHSNLGSFFDKDGADKTFCIKQGLEWTGGDTFDDFC